MGAYYSQPVIFLSVTSSKWFRTVKLRLFSQISSQWPNYSTGFCRVGIFLISFAPLFQFIRSWFPSSWGRIVRNWNIHCSKGGTMELLPVQLESKSYFLAQDVCLPTSYLLQLPINRMWQCILIAQGAPLLSLEMWESRSTVGRCCWWDFTTNFPIL